MTSCELYSLPKAPPPHAFMLGLGLQYVNLEEARSFSASQMTAFVFSVSSSNPFLPLHLAHPLCAPWKGREAGSGGLQ